MTSQEMQHSFFVEVLPEGGIATLEARLRSRGATDAVGFQLFHRQLRCG